MVRHPRRLADSAAFLCALTLYWLALAPGVLPADAGEFQIVAARLGIAHPPGYPLYTLLGWVFSLMTPANPARGVNLFSAVTMALAVMLAGRAARRLGGGVWGGVAASLALMVAASVWSTATQASIRPLAAFFTALCIERLGAYRQARSRAALVGFTLALGLGVAHHPSLIFPGVFFVLYLARLDTALLTAPRRWFAPAGAFALGFVPWLYLLVRGAIPGAPFAPEGIATWQGFWDHVLARGFAGDFFYFRTATELADRALIWLNILRLEWSAPILILAAMAGVLLAVRDWRVLAMLGGAFALHGIVTMTYRAPQTVEYLIPAYVALAVIIGAGMGPLRAPFLKAHYGDRVPALLAGLTIAASLVHLVGQWASFAWLARDDSTRATAGALLDQAPPGAVILASWHWTTPMQYLQQVEGMRPDVGVIYVYPEGAEPLAQTWVRRIEAEIEERPVIAASFYPPEFAAAPYFFEPVDGGWRVRASPRRDTPDRLTRLEPAWRLDAGLTLVGYELIGQPAVGGAFEVRAAWRIDAPQSQDITASISFNNPNIAIHNSDVLLPTTRAEVGDILISRHILGMPPYGLPSPQDEYFLLASAYVIGPDARPYNLSYAGRFYFTTLQEVVVAPPEWPVLWREDSGNVLLGGEMILAGVEVSHTGPLRPGDEVIIDLTFISQRPLVRDYVVKVDLIGEGYAWRAQSDHVPASGALPTLKWLFGWEVRDRHRLIVPPDAATSAAHAELVVYDHFTGQALPILDVELARQGVAVPLYRWEP